MSAPDQTPAGADAGNAEPGEIRGDQFRVGPLVIRKKIAIIGLAAATLVIILSSAVAMGISGYLRGREDIARLEKTIVKLTEEKAALQKKFDALNSTTNVQMIAERRCEVIDGLEDCLAAGLKRPPRFAESDRQYLETRRAALEKSAKSGSAAAPTGAAGASAGAASPAAPAPGKLSIGEFTEELRKIPGVAVESNVSEHTAPGKKARANPTTPAKPGS